MGRPRLVEDRELLDASMHAFWAKGYDGVSTRALEEATGLPASSLYHRYGSKEGLFAATLAHYNARVIAARIARYLDAGAQPDALAGIREFFTSVYRARGPYRACLLTNTAASPGPHPPAIRAALQDGGSLLRAAFVDAVRRGCATGRLRRELDPELVAEYLLLVMRGLLATARAQRDPEMLDRLVDLVLGGLAA